MRAITVQQPWADVIARGVKDVENRKASPTWRGWFGVHAGTRWSDRGAADPRIVRAYEGWRWWKEPGVLDSTGFIRGAIIAVAHLDDAHPDCGGQCGAADWSEASYEEYGGGRVVSVHHLVLGDVVALERPVYCRGSLPLGWRVDEIPEAEVLLQVPQLRTGWAT